MSPPACDLAFRRISRNVPPDMELILRPTDASPAREVFHGFPVTA